MKKIIKPDDVLIREFWEAPEEMYFGPKTISLIRNVCAATINKERWANRGILSHKVSGKILYRKKDVVAYIESCSQGEPNSELS